MTCRRSMSCRRTGQNQTINDTQKVNVLQKDLAKYLQKVLVPQKNGSSFIVQPKIIIIGTFDFVNKKSIETANITSKDVCVLQKIGSSFKFSPKISSLAHLTNK